MIEYSKEQEDYLKTLFPGYHRREVIEKFKEKYGIKITLPQLRFFMKKNNLQTGFVASEGIVPVNKGKKVTKEMYDKIKRTMFKKGDIPFNTKPMLSRRINADGYREIKVKARGHWELYSRFVYRNRVESITSDDVIIHLDGDFLNDDLENLMKISRAELVRINQRGLVSNNPGLTKAAIMQIRLEYKIKEKEKTNVNR